MTDSLGTCSDEALKNAQTRWGFSGRQPKQPCGVCQGGDGASFENVESAGIVSAKDQAGCSQR